MIYYSFNFVDSFSNATGNKRSKMVLGELGKIIRTNPKEVRLALQEADINVPSNVSDKELIRLILKNKRNKRMITNLSVLIYASASFDGGGEYEEFFGRKNKSADSSEGDKSGILAKVGEWISTRKERKAQRQAESGSTDKKNIFQKIGSFFNKNKEQIGDVASSLADGLQNNAQSSKEVMTANLKTSASVSQTQKSAGMSQKTKNALIIGGIVLIGALFYWKTKNK